MSTTMIRCIRLCLLTGQRRSEVIGIALSELSLTGAAVWTIPATRSKNGLPHRVPLAPMALLEVRRALADATEAAGKGGKPKFLFPSPDGGGPITANAVTRAMHRLCKRLGMAIAGPHDLRRTVGTGMAKLRVTPDIRSLVLNHTRGRSSSETTRVYDRHGYDDEKLEALAKWEAHVRALVSVGAAENMTPLWI